MWKFIFMAFLSVGCATKMRVPLNRMVSPESVGGSMNAEFGLGQQAQINGKIDLSGGTSPYPLVFSETRGTSFFSALSLFETFDVTWSHVSSGPSLIGGRWQFMGNSLRQAGSGNSLALTAAFGGNSHEIEGNPTYEFNISAMDLALVHGYWITSWWQVFDSFSYSTYSIQGELRGGISGDVSDKVKQKTIAVGTAVVFAPLKVKVEMAYSQLDWSTAKDATYSSMGMSLAYFY